MHKRALVLALCLIGCGSSYQPADLPNLDGLTADARAQIESVHQTATLHPGGEELGRLGLILLAYDFPTQAIEALESAVTESGSASDWGYYLGILNRQQGDLPAAAEQFADFLRSRPEDGLAELRLGETLLEQGKFGAASKRFEAVLSRDSTIALAHFLLGQARMEESRPADAVDHFRSALALQPNASQVRSPLAAALSRMGQTAEGDAQLSRRGDRPVSIDDPRMVRLDSIRFAVGATATTRAEALMQQGNYADAALLLENAVSRNPGSATIHLNLGVARANSGSRSGAILSFRRALELDSTLDKAHYNLGVIALAMNSPESAEASFLAASSGVTFNLDASVELARILRRSGRCGDALGPLRAALSEDPTRLDVRQDLVLCLHKAENDREALDVLERGLTVSPDHLGLTDGIARILATSTNEAIRDGNRALELAEKALSLQQRTETLETAALALSEVGRFDDASRLLVQAVSQADRDGPQEYATHLRSLLATVRDGQPLRTTWPTFVYQR